MLLKLPLKKGIATTQEIVNIKSIGSLPVFQNLFVV